MRNNNTGDHNTGDYNTGYRNTGDHNTGDYNTGDRNTGHYNTGDHNTGHYNTGYRNTGDYNTGYRNTGHYNTGNYNTGDYNTGDCNTDTPKVRLFNKDSGWLFLGEDHLKFTNILDKYSKVLCEWVYASSMSEEEKNNNPSHRATGGYLKVNESVYNGKEVSKEDRKFLESVPNFCPKILKETTGIIFNQTKTIVIDGKSIEISLDSFNKLRESLI